MIQEVIHEVVPRVVSEVGHHPGGNLQGRLAHNRTHSLLGPPYDPAVDLFDPPMTLELGLR